MPREGFCPIVAKISYESRRAAGQALNEMLSEPDHEPGPFNTYQCGDHWHWGHVTGLSKKARQRMRKASRERLEGTDGTP